MSEDAYRKYLADTKEQAIQRSLGGLKDVAGINPDAMGDALRIQETELPNSSPLEIAQQPELIAERKADQRKAEILRQNPSMIQWLNAPDNAALSHDEVETLNQYATFGVKDPMENSGEFRKGLESAWVGFKMTGQGLKAFAESQPVRAADTSLRLFALIDGIEGQATPEEVRKIWNEAGMEGNEDVSAGQLGAFFQYAAASPEGRDQIKKDLLKTIEVGEGELLEIHRMLAAYQAQLPEGEEFSVDNFANWAQMTAGSGIPWLAGFMLLAATTGGAGVFVGGAAASVGDTYSTGLLEGKDVTSESFSDRALTAAAASGGLEVALGPVARVLGVRLGGQSDLLEEAAESILKRAGKEVTANALEEAAQELTQEMLQEWAVEGTLEWTPEALQRRLEAAVAGAMLGGPAGGAVSLPSQVATQRKQAKAAEAALTSDKISEINETVEKTKLRDRSEKKFRQFLQTSGIDQKSLYVDAAALHTEYLKRPEIARMLGVSEQQIIDAAEAGTELPISMAEYLVNVPGRDLPLAKLVSEIGKFEPTQMSKAEGDAYIKTEQVERDAEAAAQGEKQVQQASARDKVIERVSGLLREAGQAAPAARAGAELHGAFVSTMADAYGDQVYDMLDLDIGGPGRAPETGRVLNQIDMSTVLPGMESIAEVLNEEAVTPEALLAQPQVQAAIAEMEAVPTTRDNMDDPGYVTQRVFRDKNGNPITGVAALFSELDTISGSFANGPVRQEKRVDLLLGPPAAGKSTIAEQQIAPKTGARIVDSDDIKKLIPEFGKGIGAMAVHEESSALGKVYLQDAIARGDNIVLPKVGDNVESIQKAIDLFRSNGYEVNLVVMEVDAATPTIRNMGRFVQTGRLVPPEYVASVGDKPKEVFEQLKGSVDGYARFSNEVPFGSAAELLEDTRRGADDQPAGAGQDTGDAGSTEAAGAAVDGSAAAAEQPRRLRFEQSAKRRKPESTGAETGVEMPTNLASAAKLALDNKFRTGREFKLALQKIARDTHGKNLLALTDENADKIADFIFEDAMEAVQDNQNAIGWYDSAVRRAKEELGKIYPEIGEGGEGEFAFIWALAVTSNGLKVNDNFKLAAQAYDYWKENGAFPKKIGTGTAAKQINSGLAMYTKVSQKLGGWEAARDFMVKEQEVRVIEKTTGIKISGEGKGEIVRGAAVLGPKIGNGFFSNLYGYFDGLTMDRWLMRSVGRWRGSLVDVKPENIKKKTAEIAEVMATMSDEELEYLQGFFNGSDIVLKTKMTEPEIHALGNEIAKRSTKPGWRMRFSKAADGKGDFLRRFGNGLAKYIDGQVEAPAGAKERAFLRQAFRKALAKLQQQPGMEALTMADLQALLWYPEKLLYDSAKKTAGEEIKSYEDDEAPDYGNAARNLVRDRLGSAGSDGRAERGSGVAGLERLEGAPNVDGASGPDPNLVAVAEKYAADNNIPLRRQAEFVTVDPERAKRIAQAYEEMKHDPTDPAVLSAYNSLIEQTKAQYDALVEAGYEFTFFTPETDPYGGNPWNAMRDLRANKKMAVFGTYAGYGTEGITDTVDDNPLLADTGLKWKDQDGKLQTVTANDLFRAVHDAFGHGLEGAGFRARGEENAWQAHVRLFTGEAVAAITTETRGQNSWLNYGPHGDKNRTAAVEDTVFAEQKTGLMPEWTWTEGRARSFKQSEVSVRLTKTQYNELIAVSEAMAEAAGEGLFEKAGDGYVAYLTPEGIQYLEDTLHSNYENQYGLETTPPTVRRSMVGLLQKVRTLKQDARGIIEFPANGVLNGRTVIELAQTSDLSTFLHESGHFFLEVFQALAMRNDAPQRMKDDLAKINEWMGRAADDMSPFDTNAHEQWAEGFEMYLMEGKAPTPTLKAAFAKFARWLTYIYKRAINIGSMELTDDIRGVMDRMLATEEEIALAQVTYDAAALDQPPPGMSEDEWQTYLKVAERADAEAQGRVLKSAMAKVRNQREKSYKKAVEAAKPEIEQELLQRKEYQVIQALGGKNPDFGKGARLNRKELVDTFGEGVLSELKSTVHGTDTNLYVEGGSSIELAAETFGYRNASQMLNAIRTTKKLADAVEEEARKQVDAEMGDTMTDGAIKAEAEAAIKNPLKQEQVARELTAIRRAAGQGPTRWQVQNAEIKERAEEYIGRLSVREVMNHDTFLRASQKHAREAQRHLTKVVKQGEKPSGKATQALRDAAVAKEKQLFNDHAFRIAREKARSYEANRQKFQRMSKQSIQKSIGPEFMDQIDAILDRFDLRKRGPKEAKQQLDLISFHRQLLESQWASNVDFDPEVLARVEQQHYSTLPVADMDAIIDIVNNLAHMGRSATKLKIQDQQFDLGLVLDDIADRVDENIRGEAPSRSLAGRKDRKGWNTVKHTLINADTMIEEIDHGQVGKGQPGPAYRAIKLGIDEAISRIDGRRQAAATDIAKLYKILGGTKGMAKRYGQSKVYPSLNGDRLTRMDLIMLALNSGNEGNWSRIEYDKSALSTVLLSELTTDEWKFVQETWDYLDSFWPEIDKNYRELTGLRSQKVKHKKMIANAPDFVKGGYFPIRYDKELSSSAEQIERAQMLMEGRSGSFAKAQTARGHTKQRQDKVNNKKIVLDPAIIENHVFNVIHDIELGQAVSNAGRVIYNPKFSETMTQKGRGEDVRYLKNWLEDVAIGEHRLLAHAGAKLLRGLRGSVSAQAMGFNLSTAMVQLTGIVNSFVELGPVDIARGFAQSIYSGRTLASDKSAFMRERIRTFNSDMNELTNMSRQLAPTPGGLMTKAGRQLSASKQKILPLAYLLLQHVQYQFADLPTWLAAYHKAGRDGMTEADAILYADRTVRVTQGSGRISDRSALERGRLGNNTDPNAAVTLATIMYSFMNMKLNRLYLAGRGLGKGYAGGDLRLMGASLAAFVILLFADEVGYQLIKNGVPDEDEDETWGQFFGNVATGPLALLPVVGRPAQAAITGGYQDKGLIGNAIGDLSKAVEGGFDFLSGGETNAAEAMNDIMTGVGFALGLPLNQLGNLVENFFDPNIDDETRKQKIARQFGASLVYDAVQ